jgi:hypothetical protein
VGRRYRPFAVVWLLATTIGPAAGQSEQVDPFLISGALGLEAEIEACAPPITSNEKEQLQQAIRTLQQRAKLPDELFVKVRRELRARKADPEWKEVQEEVCKDMQINFRKYLAEVLEKTR